MKLPTLARFFVISAVASVLSSNVNAQDLKAPADVAAPPKDAIKEDSGLASKVLTKGSGTRKPKATDQVKGHDTGWTTEGEVVESAGKLGTPSTCGGRQ